MSALAPSALVAAAGSLIGLRDGSVARDAEIRQLLGGYVAGRRRPWASALIHHAGYWSHFQHRSRTSNWPLPRVRQVPDLAEYAAAKNVLSFAAPQPGEIFVLWSPAKQHFVHTGILLSVEPIPLYREDDVGQAHRDRRYVCSTIEGEVTSTGGFAGPHLGRVRRVLSPARGDRTIRWTELDARDRATAWASPRHPDRPASRNIETTR